jgi:hypothetical protein
MSQKLITKCGIWECIKFDFESILLQKKLLQVLLLYFTNAHLLQILFYVYSFELVLFLFVCSHLNYYYFYLCALI